MKVAHYGEDRLVNDLLAQVTLKHPRLRVPPGDDCAAVGRERDKTWQLLKTDCVVEGVHFLPEADPRLVGRKALCRPLSDIAAMGGAPGFALVTIGLPKDRAVEWVKEVYRSIGKAAREFGVTVAGGETTSAPITFISVAVTGNVERKLCVTRSGGRPGDRLFVTGRLGGSISGKHLRFTPRLAEAQWLVANHLPTAMMDLSDGLGSDLPRLAAASRCGFNLRTDRIPRIRGCSLEQALTDGEDYELLIAIKPQHVNRLAQGWAVRFPKLPLTQIGELVEDRAAGNLQLRGHDHFTGH